MSPVVSAREIQVAPETAETDTVAGVLQIEDSTKGTTVSLRAELDSRLSSLEEKFARQTRDLLAIREMTVQRELRIGEVAAEIELLCERVSSPSTLVASPQIGAAAQFPKRALEQDEDERRSRMKAMFAFEESEPHQEKRAESEQREVALCCPTCRSSHTRPAHRLTFLDECLRSLALNPWRCRRCKSRFYHVRWGAPIDLAAARQNWQATMGRLSSLTRLRRPKPTETLAH